MFILSEESFLQKARSPISPASFSFRQKAAVAALVFGSGFASLVYQVLWMRQLGLLFGNTSYAAAATLAAFFGGLAAGSWFWGRRSAAMRNPMRVFAGLEGGIAVAALLYFVVLALFYRIYPAVYQSVHSVFLLLVVKFGLALLLVFPPAFLMGGTIPVLGQAVIRDRDELGVRAAWLYAVNTFGAALGALSAGFCFVRIMGFRATCFLAMAISAVVALGAAYLSRGTMAHVSAQGEGIGGSAPKSDGAGQAGVRLALFSVCFLSGFGMLALEVLWTRLFAQVHENSVYSFSTVLVIVLLSLALGAAVSSRLAHIAADPIRVLAVLLLAGGGIVAVSPFLFMWCTGGFQMIDSSETFAAYVWDLFGKGALVIGLPAFCLGMVFPFLMKVEERFALHVGASLGRLSAVNTVGAIAGALLCGFVFLSQFGMWRTMQGIAALYLMASLFMPLGWSRAGIVLRVVGGVGLLSLFTWLSPADLPVTGRDRSRPEEQLVELWETSDCTVSVVVTEPDGCIIKVNSNYRLGSTGAAWREHFQGRIPLLFYPDARSVFFLGVGTGISAGGALDPRFKRVERVVACDLVPEVIDAARKYMTGAFRTDDAGVVDFTSGLFSDERVEIVVEDGRHYLMACDESFDIINADLFLPYRSGAGSLYSREHFENVRKKLNSGGVFVQWLPMYQLTETEFGTIARTMLDVFDQVSMWRNNFKPGQETVALVGHRDVDPLPSWPSGSVDARKADIAGKDPAMLNVLDLTYDESTALVFYCGNLTAAEDLFSGYPVNTDDRPVIEYSSPLSMRKREGGYIPALVGPRFEALIDEVQARCPAETDPMLAQHTEAQRKLVTAGTELHRFWLAKAMQDGRKAQRAWFRFVRAWTDQ